MYNKSINQSINQSIRPCSAYLPVVASGESVVEQLLRYLACVCDDEIVGIEDHLACLCSVVSILLLLFTSDPALARGLSASKCVCGGRVWGVCVWEGVCFCVGRVCV